MQDSLHSQLFTKIIILQDYQVYEKCYVCNHIELDIRTYNYNTKAKSNYCVLAKEIIIPQVIRALYVNKHYYFS